jgi:hypothetical protein
MFLKQRILRAFVGASAVVLSLCAAGCGGGSHTLFQMPISVSFPGKTVTVSQGGMPAVAQILIQSTSETALVSVNGLPAGIQWKYAASESAPSGTLTFTANDTTPAGTYMPIVTVNSAGQMASASLTLVVAT